MQGRLPVIALLPGAAQADTGDVKASVPSTLALTVGSPGDFGALTPGLAKDYGATMTAGVVSTAGGATLSVADTSPTGPGHRWSRRRRCRR